MSRASRMLVGLIVLLLALGVMAVSAAACGGGGGGAEPTSLTTSLSGESKEGETITVLEGAAIKDKATLSGTNASKATGTVKYDVYSDKECKTLVTAAGEVTVTSGSVPASSEETLEAGTYYWQAVYSGDSKNSGSTSTCSAEIATVMPPAPRTEQIDFGGNEEVLIDHTKSASHEEVKKLYEELVKPESAKGIEAVNGKDKVEWKSPNAGEVKKNWPLVYPKATTMELLETRLALPPATQIFLKKKLEGEVTVIGKTKVAGVAIEFEQKLTEMQAKEQMEGANPEYLKLPKVTASAALPAEVRYEQITITWKWKAKARGGALFEQALGTSTHNLYMTYGKAVSEPIYFTLLAESTVQIEKISTKPTRAQVISGVWNAFKNLPGIHVWIYNPESATGEIQQTKDELWYYEEMPAKETLNQVRGSEAKTIAAVLGLFLTSQLLEYLEGECGAWQQALVQALEAEGVEATSIKVVVKFEKNAEKVCEAAGTCDMLVNNWKFAGGKVGLAYSEKEVEKLKGIAGEGVKTPSSFFINHQIVEVKNEKEEKKVSEIYDPAYGTGPIVSAKGKKERSFEAGEEAQEIRSEYQKKAIYGFCKEEEALCGEEGKLALEFKKVAGPSPPPSRRALGSFRPAAMWETMTTLPQPTWLIH